MKILLVDLDALVQMAMLSMVMTLQVVKVRCICIRVPHCMNESKYQYVIYPLEEGILFSQILYDIACPIVLQTDL